MKKFLGLQIKNDRLILIEEGETFYLSYDEIPEEIKDSLNQIISYAKDEIKWKS